MRYLVGALLVVNGLCGIVVSLLSDVTVASSLTIINGMQLSTALGLFSIVAVVGGLCNLFSNE